MKKHGVALGKPYKLLQQSQLKHWVADYGASSIEVHGKQVHDADLLAMSESRVNGFLLGRSSQGFGRVAHSASIMLSIITANLLTLIEDEGNNSFGLTTAIYAKLIKQSSDTVGNSIKNKIE